MYACRLVFTIPCTGHPNTHRVTQLSTYTWINTLLLPWWKNFKWKLLWETKWHTDNETTDMTTATIIKQLKISPVWPLCPGCNASGHELYQPDFSWDTMTFMCQPLWGANTAMPLGFLSSLPKCTFSIRKTIQLNGFLWERSLDLCIYW